jgi:hypothetical protein
MKTRVLLLFSTVLFSLLLVGCGSKISQSNFEKVQNDMTQEQVVAILGKPTESSSGGFAGVSGGSMSWKDKNGEISVQLLNGKVIGKQSNFTSK